MFGDHELILFNTSSLDGDFDGAAAAILSRVHGHERQNGKRVTVFYRGLVPRRELEAAPFKNTKSRSVAK
jgi:hypothetical protein